MNKIELYNIPNTVKEAVAALNAPRANAAVLAGGTQLNFNIPAETNSLVDLRNIPLKYINADAKWLYIGANTTFTELLASPLIKKWACGILYDAAYLVSSKMIRNMGTVGGNIVRPMPYNHLPSIFMALDAKVVVAGKKGIKTVSVEELSGKEYFGILGRKCLITEIRIPAETKNNKARFEKFAKTESMWESFAIAAVSLSIKNGKCSKAAIAVGSAVPRALRFPQAEALLAGAAITPETARAAAQSATDAIKEFTSIQASPSYKKEVLPVVIERCILKACGIDAQ